MSQRPDSWTEDDSRTFREIAEIGVPYRLEQLNVQVRLIPFESKESIRVVELGCGDGRLSHMVLDAFPNATVIGLDGSQSMREVASARLERFGSRAVVAPFDLRSMDWLPVLDSADCVLSSLAIHHLVHDEKKRLFSSVYGCLADFGVFLVADLIEPQRPEARHLFADDYDRIAKGQAVSTSGSTDLFDRLVDEKWNYFRFPDPDEQPSPLFDQLTWLSQSGVEDIDCFWFLAGHAIFGGYKLQGVRGSSESTEIRGPRTPRPLTAEGKENDRAQQ